jgi:hypothetical protein
LNAACLKSLRSVGVMRICRRLVLFSGIPLKLYDKRRLNPYKRMHLSLQ